ncbi:MAG: RNA polymerase sigma factor [Kofleriaceae bacterium]|nr:RNA polymerase sigma factor [Myxococcales bacterium]MCB9561754.1 RNA polymerase sigma factor [Kofleriaceae bacterium]MCB9573697.1 RNA polymerase sigma factor [Kofleriaceae bacterium]
MTSRALDVRRAAADRDLAVRCAQGERAAQRELFMAQRDRVHRTLYRILGSNRDMEDLVQEVFLEVFRGIERFRGDSTLATWCATIATRTAWAYIERRKPQAAALELVPEPMSEEPGAERTVAAKVAAQHLYAAMDRLAAPLRIAFALAAIEGLPLAEVASLTGSTLVATKTRVWRARREIERRAAKDPMLRGYVVHLGGAPAEDVP